MKSFNLITLCSKKIYSGNSKGSNIRIYPKYSERHCVDPYKTKNAASDLGLHCLPLMQQFKKYQRAVKI